MVLHYEVTILSNKQKKKVNHPTLKTDWSGLDNNNNNNRLKVFLYVKS